MNARYKRIVIGLVIAMVALGGSAAVLPLGSRSHHAIVPAAAIASLILAVVGFCCLLVAVAAAIGYGRSA